MSGAPASRNALASIALFAQSRLTTPATDEQRGAQPEQAVLQLVRIRQLEQLRFRSVLVRTWAQTSVDGRRPVELRGPAAATRRARRRYPRAMAPTAPEPAMRCSRSARRACARAFRRPRGRGRRADRDRSASPPACAASSRSSAAAAAAAASRRRVRAGRRRLPAHHQRDDGAARGALRPRDRRAAIASTSTTTPIRTARLAVMARLVRGEPVDPAEVYFRCLPRFEMRGAGAAPGSASASSSASACAGRRRSSMRFFEVLLGSRRGATNLKRRQRLPAAGAASAGQRRTPCNPARIARPGSRRAPPITSLSRVPRAPSGTP